MSVTFATILAKLASRCCNDCKRAERIDGRTRCQACYNRYAAVLVRRRRGGSYVPYRAHVRDQSCSCGNSSCDGMRCERASA